MTPTIAKNQMLIMDRRRVQQPVCRHDYKYAIYGGMSMGMDKHIIEFYCPKCKTKFLKGYLIEYRP